MLRISSSPFFVWLFSPSGSEGERLSSFRPEELLEGELRVTLSSSPFPLFTETPPPTLWASLPPFLNPFFSPSGIFPFLIVRSLKRNQFFVLSGVLFFFQDYLNFVPSPFSSLPGLLFVSLFEPLPVPFYD